MRTSFGGFVLDTNERRLLAGEREVRLSPKMFDLLAMLVDSRPKALSKDVIFARLWPDTFVTENNLATLITDLRAALGDNAHHPQYVRTVYGYGYAFIAEAVEQNSVTVDAASRERQGTPSDWRLLHEYREIALAQGDNVLGRSGAGVIVLESSTISRHHATIAIAGDRATIEDLGSKNGTWIGTIPVTAAVPLQDGDELRLGSVVMMVRFRNAGTSTETIATSRG